MRSGRRSLLAFWLAIQLLVGQQLALAHAADHLGKAIAGHAAATAPAPADGDQKRDGPHDASHVCTACLGCLGFDAMPAADAGIVCAQVTWARGSRVAVPSAPTFKQAAPFQSRAPPSLQG